MAAFGVPPTGATIGKGFITTRTSITHRISGVMSIFVVARVSIIAIRRKCESRSTTVSGTISIRKDSDITLDITSSWMSIELAEVGRSMRLQVCSVDGSDTVIGLPIRRCIAIDEFHLWKRRLGCVVVRHPLK